MYRSKISNDFSNNMSKMKVLFMNAHQFLASLAENNIKDFWLSTAQNAHLYYKDGYYVYIKLSIATLILSPQYNGRIESSTRDNSRLIFLQPIRDVIDKFNGFNESWASIDGLNEIKLTNKTPLEFFAKLLELIQKSHR